MSRLRATYRHPSARDYSAPGGPWDVPTLDALFRSRASSRIEAVVEGTVRLGTLEPLVAQLAGGLRAAGVRRGDVVAWQLPNCYEAVLLYRACWRLGAVAGPIHHQAGASELERMLRVLEPKLTLLRDDVRGRVARFSKLLAAEPVESPAARPSDLAVVLFTSGSAGEPKAAMHTHRGLAHKALTMARAHGLAASDSVLMPAPLAHVSGLLNAVLIPGVVPMKAVLVERWDPNAALEIIERERITFMIGPPTFFVTLMGASRFDPGRVATLRLVSCGGAGVTASFVEHASATLDCRVKRTYGSTEAPTITTSTPRDPETRARETDGHPVGMIELRVTNPQTGHERAAGEPGELWLRGPELFVGYADAAQTRAAVNRGWFRTGDAATVDSGGWLTIVGRMKDVIIRGGENIAAAEVEAALEAHPDVHQAVAVGYPDARLGERVCAFVVATRPFDVEACRAWFAHFGVARFKTPERIVQVDELPVLAAGKPDRHALAERAAALA